jgi:GH25 family lysozyme M1 (1,4-beta-N-acetylmuramidase)
MPAPSRRWLMSACCAAASLVLTGLGAGPASADTAAGAAAGQLVTSTDDRYNVGATHSPQVLHELAGTSTPMTGTGQMAPGVTASAVLPGAEQGVDVSSHQHPNGAAINWSQVAASGIGFAAVKVTEGSYYPNPYAAGDLAQAQAAGLSVVAYAYAIPNGNGGSTSPVVQADYLLQNLGAARSSVPIMLDIEYNPYGAECYGLTTTAMVNWISKFDNEIKAKTGRLPIIYTPRSWWNTCTGSSTGFGHTPLWVPYYTTSSNPPPLPAGWSTWGIWQYSSTGTVPGIASTNHTDLDQANPAILSLLNPGGTKQTVGDPVGMQMAQATPAPGQTVSYTATGLPKGASISTAGQITGWLKTAGSYPVTVSASSSAGTTGSVSFTWTVAAAPNAGPTGPVTFGVGGTCLNDKGNSSADGTPVNIWTCNGSSSQQWTVAQDQTLRIHGKCLAVSGSAKVNGSKVVLATCAGYASQQWSVGTRGQLINATAGKCLGGSSSGTNGVQAWISTCNGKSNQKWTLPAGPVVSEVPGICVTDQGGITTDGNPVVTGACGQAAQTWAAQPDGTLSFAGKCLDISDSNSVDLSTCNGSAAQQWQITAAGGGQQLVNPQSGLCLADPGDSQASGTQLVVKGCTAGDPGMNWRIR